MSPKIKIFVWTGLECIFPRNDKNSLSKEMCIKKIKTKSDHSSLAMPRSRNLIWPYPTCSLSASLNYIRSHNLHVPQNGTIQLYTNGYMVTETRNVRINIMNTNCFSFVTMKIVWFLITCIIIAGRSRLLIIR